MLVRLIIRSDSSSADTGRRINQKKISPAFKAGLGSNETYGGLIRYLVELQFLSFK